jgi:LDH2 family malate/lactate/ureidoglycolate dehydrogenase
MAAGSNEPAGSLRVDAEQLTDCCAAIFEGAGLQTEHARHYAHSLVLTDLRGHNSHGVIRVPFYVERLQKGGDNLRPQPRVERETVATAVLDGDRGPGHIVARHAMELAIAKAKDTGIGFVSARNSGHFGAAQLWAMQALAHDMIGLAWTNGPPVMTPWGGAKAAISNNPLAIAAPAATRPPLVLDTAFSTVAGGKVRLAAKKGERIPDNWIVDSAGRPSTDPNDLPNGGALLPVGHKGYAMAVMAEALAGVLPGGTILGEMRIWFDIPAEPTRYNHVFQAIRIDAFGDVERYKARVDEVIARLKATPPAPGFTEVLVPGELEHRSTETQLRDGVLLPGGVVEDLRRLGRDFALPAALHL